MLLSEADMANKRLLSSRADQIWAYNMQLHHDTVAIVAVATESDGADGAGAQVAAATPMLLARQSAGLCDSHWKYGDAAFTCNDLVSCKWQGN